MASTDAIHLDNGCGQAIAAFDKAVPVIREKSEDVLTEMRQSGPELLDAAATNEHEIINLNQRYGVLLAEPIVAVYPQDGIAMNAHPFAILDGAPWVTREQIRAAELFRDFLLAPERQGELLQYGFRPANPSVVMRADDREQWRSWGANPDANLAIAELPSPEVIRSILKLWESIRTAR